MIRSATIDDTIEIVSMWECLQKDISYGFETEYLDGKERERWFCRLVERVNSPTDFVIVAEHGKSLVGFICGSIGHDGVHPMIIGKCTDLYVKPAARGKMVSKQLYEALERECRDAGAHLFEFEQNYTENAGKKWERRGYVPTSITFQRKVSHG